MELPNRELLVTVEDILYPVGVDVLQQVFGPYGVLDNIEINQESPTVQASVTFATLDAAIKAKDRLHDRFIYDGCCLLMISFSQPVALSTWVTVPSGSENLSCTETELIQGELIHLKESLVKLTNRISHQKVVLDSICSKLQQQSWQMAENSKTLERTDGCLANMNSTLAVPLGLSVHRNPESVYVPVIHAANATCHDLNAITEVDQRVQTAAFNREVDNKTFHVQIVDDSTTVSHDKSMDSGINDHGSKICNGNISVLNRILPDVDQYAGVAVKVPQQETSAQLQLIGSVFEDCEDYWKSNVKSSLDNSPYAGAAAPEIFIKLSSHVGNSSRIDDNVQGVAAYILWPCISTQLTNLGMIQLSIESKNQANRLLHLVIVKTYSLMLWCWVLFVFDRG